MGTLKPGSHHEVLRSVCPRLYGAAAGYALPYAAPHIAYAHAPVVYNPLESGLVYPVAEAYVHDATGDVADDVSPAAEAYVHDAAGDEAEAYVHDVTGDA